MPSSQESSVRPVAKFQFGAVSAAVFLNERTRRDDSTFVGMSTVLQRTYLDEHGEFQNSSSFGPNDLPKAILALQRAFEFCVSRRDERVDDDEPVQ